MKPSNAYTLQAAFRMAAHFGARAVMVYADLLDDFQYEGRFRKKTDLYLLSKKKNLEPNGEGETSLLHRCKGVLTLPKVQLSRIAVIKFATATALSMGTVEKGDKIVFAVGAQEPGILDHLQLLDTAKESEMIVSRGLGSVSEAVRPEVFQAVLLLSVELAQKGREGKPLGTIFVVGDHEKVLPLTKQMIINPFKGYEEEERNILNPHMKETLREFAAMDGAFIISDDGTVLTAGAYLGASIEESNVTRGLGSRHLASAGITNLTKAIAFVISESSGDVRIFKDGKLLTQIEKTGK